jgi:hypothetical protein
MASDASTGHRGRNLWPDRRESAGNPAGSGHRSTSGDVQKSLLRDWLYEAGAQFHGKEGVVGSSPTEGSEKACKLGLLVGRAVERMYVPIVTCGQLRPQRSQRYDIAAGWTRSRRRSLPAIALGARERPERRHRLLVEIRDRQVGAATETLPTKAEQVSDNDTCAPEYACWATTVARLVLRLKQPRRRRGRRDCSRACSSGTSG